MLEGKCIIPPCRRLRMYKGSDLHCNSIEPRDRAEALESIVAVLYTFQLSPSHSNRDSLQVAPVKKTCKSLSHHFGSITRLGIGSFDIRVVFRCPHQITANKISENHTLACKGPAVTDITNYHGHGQCGCASEARTISPGCDDNESHHSLLQRL